MLEWQAPVMLLFVTVLLAYLQFVIGHIEIIEERGFQDSSFRLTCRELSSLIAILDAYFIERSPLAKTHDIRPYLNYRCSGRNHCSFILHADNPISKDWGQGEVFIKYACMSVSHVVRYCNQDIHIGKEGCDSMQGFVLSPGYPKFYVGQSVCRWRIWALRGTVQLSLLDVSLGAEDTLSIRDALGELRSDIPPSTLNSRAGTMDVVLYGRPGSLVPKRGLLFYYQATNCTSESFQDELWDTGQGDHVFPCLKNNTSTCIHLYNVTQISRKEDSNMTDSSNLIDIIIPSILIAALLICNAVIVFIIYQYRKRKNVDIFEEELSTMVEDTNQVP